MNISLSHLAACVALLFALCIPSHAQLRLDLGRESQMLKLGMAESAILNLYVDSVNEKNLTEDAIRGMLSSLDPHSSYTTAGETKALNESLNGSFDGIGIQFNMQQDTLLVIQTIANGPSEKAGILPGDRIIAVGDTTIAGVKMADSDIMRRLRGPKGTIAHLSVIRRGIHGVLMFDVKRDRIPVKTIDAAYMIRPSIGYVRIGSFGATTYKEFMNCIDTLRTHGMTSLILDLEDNGGGYLQAAVQMANEFLQKDDLIVYTQGRRTRRNDFTADGSGSLQQGRVAVLINEFTASAAEIVTGALQDQDRAIVVGRRSFGKGLVQRPIDFADGSMLRLTVAHYYTPAGRCIQKPYKKGGKLAYEMELDNRFKHGELYSADSIHFPDSLRCYTLRRHRTVYGGGGIMPDLFVALDTTQYTALHRNLVARGIVLKHDLAFMEAHRKELLRTYPHFDDFMNNYEVPSALIDSVIAEGRKMNIKPAGDEELHKTIPTLRLQLKGLIARDIWDMSQYFQIINEANPIVRRAVEYMTEP